MTPAPRERLALPTAAALAVALILAFFLVLRTLFTDGPGDPLHLEYLVAYAVNAIGYGLAVGLFVRLAPARPPWWVAWIAGPGVLLVLVYTDATWALRLATLGSVALGAAAGAAMGRK